MKTTTNTKADIKKALEANKAVNDSINARVQADLDARQARYQADLAVRKEVAAVEAAKVAQQKAAKLADSKVSTDRTLEEKTMTEYFAPLPEAVDGAPCVLPLLGLNGTIADPARKEAVMVNGVRIPAVKARTMVLNVMVEGDKPVFEEFGRHKVEVLVMTEDRAVYKVDGKRFATGRQAPLDALKAVGAQPGMIINSTDPGNLVARGRMEEKFLGLYAEVPQWVLSVDKALQSTTVEGFNSNMATASMQAVVPARQACKAILEFRSGLTLRAPVLSSPKAKIGRVTLGRKIAQMLLDAYNNDAVKEGIPTIDSIDQMDRLAFEQFGRFPGVSPKSFRGDMTIAVAQDNTWNIYLHPLDMLGMNADSDGDAPQGVVAQKETFIQADLKDLAAPVTMLGKIDSIGLPVDKNGNVWNPYTEKKLAPADPIEVALALAAGKAPVGHLSNGFGRLIHLASIIAKTPVEREVFLRKSGMTTDQLTINNGRNFRAHIAAEVRVAFGCANERLMSVRKDGNVWKAALDGLQMFFAKDGVMLDPKDFQIDGEWMEADGLRYSEKLIKLLNAIKGAAGKVSMAKAMKQAPVLSELVGRNDGKEMASYLRQNGAKSLLGVIDGSVTPPVSDEAPSKYTRPIDGTPAPRDLAGFKESDITPEKGFGWTRIAQFVNAHNEKVNANVPFRVAFKLDEDNTAIKMTLFVDGQPINLRPITFTLNNGVIASGNRMYRLVAIPADANAAGRIDKGEKPQAAIELRIETVLDELAEKMVGIVSTVRSLRDGKTDKTAAITAIVRSSIEEVLSKGFYDYQAYEATRLETRMSHTSEQFPGVDTTKMDATLLEIAIQLHAGFIHPLTGKTLHTHVGQASKNHHVQVIALLEEGETTTQIDRTAHLIPNEAGVRNEARENREAWTAHTAMELATQAETIDDYMLAGGEDEETLLTKFVDVNVMIANVDQLHFPLEDGSVACFDNALLTNKGCEKLQVIRRPNQKVGLTADVLEEILLNVTGEATVEAAKVAAKFDGYVTTKAYSTPIGTDRNRAVSEARYNLSSPVDTDSQTTLKTYSAGWKGEATVIDQDIEATTLDGKKASIDLVIDGRTASGKKMMWAVLCGMLGIMGKRDFKGATLESVLAELAAFGGPFTEFFDAETGKSLGFGIATRLRTCVLKSDIDDVSVKRNGMKQSPDILSFTARPCRVPKTMMTHTEDMVHFSQA